VSELLPKSIDVCEDDYNDLLRRCDALSSFQLSRLGSAIEQMLADPDRIQQVRKLIQVGDEIDYFDGARNRCVRAIVRKLKRTRVSVTNVEDGEHWSVFYSSINVGGEDISHAPTSGPGLTRGETAVGDVVGFADKHGHEQVGTIVKLNQKTVGVDCEDGKKWRVSYGLLYPILDGTTQQRRDGLLIEGEFKVQQKLIE
jgi:hypothetical protein